VVAVEKSVRDLREQTPDIHVIYLMHGLENYEWKTPNQVATARALKNAGVNLVVDSGAHMIQEREYDGDQWTFYGIGNFLFNALGRR
jgi:poly-gamma-glutamate capsule biosynthesis protein CapA/YwtB (metallophosphatase superfamily)